MSTVRRGWLPLLPRVVCLDPRPTLKPNLPKSVIKLQFLSKSRPRPWTVAVLVVSEELCSPRGSQGAASRTWHEESCLGNGGQQLSWIIPTVG